MIPYSGRYARDQAKCGVTLATKRIEEYIEYSRDIPAKLLTTLTHDDDRIPPPVHRCRHPHRQR